MLFKNLQKSIDKRLSTLRHIYSYFSRREPDLWVFGCWQGFLYADNARYFFEYINKHHPEIRPVWITKDKNILQTVRDKGYRAEMADSKKGRSLCLHAGVVFMSEGHRDVCEDCIIGALQIQLWHAGMGPKALKWIKPLKDRDSWKKVVPYDHSREYWMMTCQAASDLHSRIFNADINRFFVTGSCRLDNLVRKPINPEFEALKKERPGQKFIIYTPTHRNWGKDKSTFISQRELIEIDNRLEKMKVTMIFKPHYHELKRYAQYKIKLNNIILATNSAIYGNIYEYLHYMDAMIADYSSLFYDYTCMDKPEIFYVYDIERYKKADAGLIEDYEDVVPGPICKTWEATLDAVEKELKEDNYREKRRAFCKLYNPFNDGKSCERVYNKVMELMKKR